MQILIKHSVFTIEKNIILLNFLNDWSERWSCLAGCPWCSQRGWWDCGRGSCSERLYPQRNPGESLASEEKKCGILSWIAVI